MIVDKIGNKRKFPRLICPEAPCYGERISECFNERFAEVSGKEYKLFFLYSTINEALQWTIGTFGTEGTPYCAILEFLLPINPHTKDPVRRIATGFADNCTI